MGDSCRGAHRPPAEVGSHHQKVIFGKEQGRREVWKTCANIFFSKFSDSQAAPPMRLAMGKAGAIKKRLRSKTAVPSSTAVVAVSLDPKAAVRSRASGKRSEKDCACSPRSHTFQNLVHTMNSPIVDMSIAPKQHVLERTCTKPALHTQQARRPTTVSCCKRPNAPQY